MRARRLEHLQVLQLAAADGAELPEDLLQPGMSKEPY